MAQSLGLTEGVSMALGGMIGGGIFAVLGVVVQLAGGATWFAVGLSVLPEAVAGYPLRPVVSVLTVAGFVGLNLLGAQATGSIENVLVGLKVLILLRGTWADGVVDHGGTGPEVTADDD
jgi:amino acid transporter